ncbi:hypothetical protein DFH27DRAFT_657127 [Peziza echinospora]|nr:hypothetical protein DFH27DRAFT_657127 [Peziza echinospora]
MAYTSFDADLGDVIWDSITDNVFEAAVGDGFLYYGTGSMISYTVNRQVNPLTIQQAIYKEIRQSIKHQIRILTCCANAKEKDQKAPKNKNPTVRPTKQRRKEAKFNAADD